MLVLPERDVRETSCRDFEEKREREPAARHAAHCWKMMRLLRRLGNYWLGAVYRHQAARRMDRGIHRASGASARNCGNCLRCLQPGPLPFKRCQAHQLVVHRRDICRNFTLKVDA
ncbi:hypothetical protein [Caldimonas tepidiphila]|uniref:hypothetical protein n=1 Tax=Caldimonas tepidiphila TaxID=2315841 RepID=UPI001300A87D|nr:hypothetical protein [Caldimonas tepidiphila]